jgi:hypothetical protein
VVGGSIAAFGLLIGDTFTWPSAIAVTFLAAGAIVVTALWRYNWSRHKVSIDNCWIRMREIERARGMKKNMDLYLRTKGRDKRTKVERDWAVFGVDEPYKEFPEPPGARVVKPLLQCKIRDSFRSLPRSLCGLLPPLPCSGQGVLHGTAFLVQLGWGLMALFKVVDAFLLADSAGVHHFHP